MKDTPLARDEEALILEFIPPLVTDEMNESLRKPITLDELEWIVFQMNKGKAPSPYGFPIEFYIKFWELVKLDQLKIILMAEG